MSESAFVRLEDVVLDESFPDVDLALRRGRHIDRDDGTWFTFLCDAQAHLESFYRRFGAELVRRSEGYFYLLPSGDRLGRRQLSLAEMLVGQALTLLYLDPATIEGGGTVTRAAVLSHLASVMGTESLIRALNPKRKKYDERVAQETVRARVGEALRRLGTLGFVDFIEEERMRLRPSLMRFAEPVRDSHAQAEALEKLVAAGEVVLTDEDEPSERDSAELGDDFESSEPEEEEFALSDEELAALDPSDEAEAGRAGADLSPEPEPESLAAPSSEPEFESEPDFDPNQFDAEPDFEPEPEFETPSAPDSEREEDEA